jgi:hypothetical protein
MEILRIKHLQLKMKSYKFWKPDTMKRGARLSEMQVGGGSLYGRTTTKKMCKHLASPASLD